jgi:hypothetical protein
MSIASIGQKILIACKYATIAMLLVFWCGFTGVIGSFVGTMMSGSNFAQYTGAAIGALAGLVFAIGMGQLETGEKKSSKES